MISSLCSDWARSKSVRASASPLCAWCQADWASPSSRLSRRVATHHGDRLRSRRATTGRHDRRPANGACCHFFPDPWDWGQRLTVPEALSSSSRRCFASARQCLQNRRTRQHLPCIGPQRSPPAPIAGNAYGWRSHCRSAPQAMPSTDIRFAAPTPWLQTPVAGLCLISRRQRSRIGHD